jgi:Tol biopolymer transport system component
MRILSVDRSVYADRSGHAGNVLVFLLCFFLLFLLMPFTPGAAYASPGDIALVSISQTGVPGNSACFCNAISADGRYVAFYSDALNLVPGGTSAAQVLRKDMQTGEVLLCNADASGVEGNNGSNLGDINLDGRYVAFQTTSSNLIGAADANGSTDVYRKDLATGAVARCSTSTSGAEIPGSAYAREAAISGNARYVAFQSNATNLHPGDSDTNADIYRKDMVTGQLDLCDTSALGTKGNDSAGRPDVSEDGRYVVFESGATNLMAASGASSTEKAAVSGTAIPYQVFRKDMQSGESVCVSITPAGQQGNATSESASISTDGRYVVFQSLADNLVPGDTNGALDIFRKDLVTGELIRCSTSSSGAQGESISTEPSISPDGRFAAFASTFKNMVPGDTNNFTDIFRKDCLSGETVRVSTSASGEQSNNTSNGTAISSGGKYVAFDSYADNLVPGDGNSQWDVFRKELGTSYTWYFAEGYTGAGFQEYLCLGQPVDAPISVKVTYLFKDGTTPLERTYDVPALSRKTVNVNQEVGPDKEVSLRCEADSPFLAERPMYFDYTGGGGNWTGGHDVMGAAWPSKTWYFAEGYTGAGFDEWICVLNPGNDAADLTFRFQTQEEGTKTVTGLSVPAHSRGSFKANQLLEGKSYQTSLALESTQPVVAERPMYFNYGGTNSWNWTGGHCVMGVPALARNYFFAEGSTRLEFEEWLTLQNPGTAPITVNAVYQLGPGQGSPIPKSYVVEGGRRYTVYVPKEVGTLKDVSVRLSSASYFLAERPMYFNYQGTGAWNWTGGHCVIGAMGEAYGWFFAEGYTGDGFEEWLCLQNTGTADAQVEVVYYPEGGGAPITKPHTVPASSRYTVPVNADAGKNLSISCEVASDQPIIVERPMYFNFQGRWTGGHDVVGYAP